MSDRWKDVFARTPEAPVKFRLLARVVERMFETRDHMRALEARVAALEKRPVGAKDAGVWRHGVTYEQGDIVSFKGSGWICRETHYSVGAEPDHSKFRLFVKAGRDAR